MGIEVLLREAPARSQCKQAVLEVGQLQSRHHLHSCELAQLRKPSVSLQFALLFVRGRTKPSTSVKLEIGVLVLALQLCEPLPEPALEAQIGPVLGAGYLG